MTSNASLLDTLLVHDSGIEGGPVVPPINQTSLFTFKSVSEMEACFAGEIEKPIYSRGRNPTVQIFEEKIAALEGAEAARGFASGMAAISSTILAFAKAGDRIVCVKHVYPDAYRLFRRLFSRLGIETLFVDGRDLGSVRGGLPGAKLIYLESPTSVVFDVLDIASIAQMARDAGVVSVIDNSWATPIFQRPLKQGIDLTLHSASKYISGHSDTVAGVVAGAREHIDRIDRLTYPFLGGKLAPFEAWLLLRGLRTLSLRLRHQQQSAQKIADFLLTHSLVDNVNYPSIADGATLSGTSGLLSFEFAQSIDIAKFCERLHLFRLGVSWGGHESLVFPAFVGLRQAGEHNSLVDFGVSPRLVRLSIGLEDCDALIGDLEQAIRFSHQL